MWVRDLEPWQMQCETRNVNYEDKIRIYKCEMTNVKWELQIVNE